MTMVFKGLRVDARMIFKILLLVYKQNSTEYNKIQQFLTIFKFWLNCVLVTLKCQLLIVAFTDHYLPKQINSRSPCPVSKTMICPNTSYYNYTILFFASIK